MSSSRLHETTLKKIQTKKKGLQKEKDSLTKKLQDIDKRMTEIEKMELTLISKYNKAKKKEEEANKEWEAYEMMADQLGLGKTKSRIQQEVQRIEENPYEEKL